MLPHTRALVAAAAHAFIFRRTVVGVHDHTENRDLQIAAETRGDQVQAHDGDRDARLSGALPELYDAGDKAFISMTIAGTTAEGYDRASSSHYSLTATEEVVQVFDHAAGAWFAFSIQVA